MLLGLVWSGDSVAQSGNYLIQPGDSLAVEVLEDAGLNRTVLVTPDGRVSFPLAGTVQAAGRTVTQVARAITAGLTDDFAAPPNVFVSVVGVAAAPEGELGVDGETIIVYVLGEVNSPGPKTVLAGTTVLQLMAQSGGFTPFAATRRVQLRRNDPATGQQRLFEIDYRAISRGAQIVNEPTVREGDVLLVPERRLFE
jgi:polysaccharide export outer membrane protein